MLGLFQSASVHSVAAMVDFPTSITNSDRLEIVEEGHNQATQSRIFAVSLTGHSSLNTGLEKHDGTEQQVENTPAKHWKCGAHDQERMEWRKGWKKLYC